MKKIILLLTALFLSGCSSPLGEFFSTRYENTLGYFNTYYNARKSFDEALEELKKNPSKSLDTNYFSSHIINQTARTKFNIVIEKCSKIIQLYPRSRWVDDAIMMIGESYFYMNDYDLSIKKFLELIENFPNSSYYWEAHLFHAKALYHKKSFIDSRNYLEKFLEKSLEQGERDIACQGYMLLGLCHNEKEEFNKADLAFKKAAEIKASKNLKAFAYFYLGKNYLRLGNIPLASNSFYKSFDNAKEINFEYYGKMEYIRTLIQLGNHDQAFKYLNDIKNDITNNEFLSQIDLENANVYRSMGDYESAFDHYEIVDSLYARSEAASISFYNRGLIYEKELNDYSEAKFYYDKAKSETSQGEIFKMAVKKSDVLGKYIQYQRDIRNYDSLFYFAIHQDSVLRNIQSEPDTLLNPNQGETKVEKKDELNLHANKNEEEGEGNKSGDENDLLMDEEEKELRNQIKNQPDNKPLTNPPVIQPISSDSALFLLTKSQFELATLFLLDLSLPDSAEFWFDIVLRSIFIDMFAPSAFYALSEINRTKGNSVKADSFFNMIIKNYPETKYAHQVRKIMGIDYTVEIPEMEKMYSNAINLSDQKKYKESFSVLNQIYEKDTLSDYAPQALYTIGWLYENNVFNTDSAKFYYKRLIDKYPSSMYSNNIIGKIKVAEDTSNLSQYATIKEIIAPPPPAPKYNLPEGSNDIDGEQSGRKKGDRNYRDDRDDDFQGPDD